MTTNSKNLEGDFKPEVLGRIDAVLDYQGLDKSIMKNLIAKELKLLNIRLAQKRIDLELDDSVIEVLSERGYDERYGARPLSSVFNQLLIRALSRELLKGELEEGSYSTLWNRDAQKVDFRTR